MDISMLGAAFGTNGMQAMGGEKHGMHGMHGKHGKHGVGSAPSTTDIVPQLDTTGDGSLSTEDPSAVLSSQQITPLDTNQNGPLGSQERQKAIDTFRQQIRAQMKQPLSTTDMFRQMDSNGDGSLSVNGIVATPDTTAVSQPTAATPDTTQPTADTPDTTQPTTDTTAVSQQPAAATPDTTDVSPQPVSTIQHTTVGFRQRGNYNQLKVILQWLAIAAQAAQTRSTSIATA